MNKLKEYITDGTPFDVIKRYADLPQRAKVSDYGEYDRNIVVLDTETTGISLKKEELTQIAAARLEHGKITDWFVTFVNPGKPIPEDIAHLTNIHDADVVDAPTPQEALAELVEFVGDAKIVAHNAEFDRNFTTKHPQGYPLLENEWIDSLEIARIALPRMRSHRLLDLVIAFGAPLSTHRADEDVAATCALYRILLAGIDAIPSPLKRKIATLATPAEWMGARIFAYFADRDLETACANDEHALDKDDAKSNQALDKEEERDNQGFDESTARDHQSLGKDDTKDDQDLDKNTARNNQEFSLKEIRKKRCVGCTTTQKSKVDATNLLSPDLIEHARIRMEMDDETAPQIMSFPQAEEIDEAFSPEGLVGSLYEDYETRTEQVEMSEAVLQSFRSARNLMVEAGTGVGKSMAYLLPAALTAQKSNITIGVATKTNALLDQLVYHELPALAKALGTDLTFAPIKGFSHYPCLRKVQRLATEGSQMRMVMNEEKPQAPAIAMLLSFIEQTQYDDMDSMRLDYRVLPRRAISTTSHDCLRRKCPFYGTTCFVHGSRRIAENADIVVTNHSLLFCDIAADNGLLPPIRYWIVDEAHGAEAEARRALSLSISADELANLSSRVGIETSRNVFVRAERAADIPSATTSRTTTTASPVPATATTTIASPAPATATPTTAATTATTATTSTTPSSQLAPSSKDVAASTPDSADIGTLFYGLLAKAKAAGVLFYEAESQFNAHIRDLLYFDPVKKSSYESFDLWINDEVRSMQVFKDLAVLAVDLQEASERLVTASQELVGFLEEIDGMAVVQREIAAVAIELKELIQAIEAIFVNPTDEYVYSATLYRRSDRSNNTLEALLFNVGNMLGETLYANTRSVVFTSATLTVDGSFSPFERALGLNAGGHSDADELRLDSSYNFDENMRIFVLSDIPEPNTPEYLRALQRLLVDAHVAQGGSILTLFTNKKDMDALFDDVEEALRAEDLRIMKQKRGVSIKGLRDEFLKDEALSLFALKTFWEGFDAPGNALRGVIIPKLPFAKPTDPLSCERSARDDYAWRNYVLPQAVLELRQAAGRLIRKSTDTGILILADSRLTTKGYGRIFINSLPSKNVSVVTTDELISQLPILF